MKPNFTKLMPVVALNLAAQAAFAGNITDINVSVLPDQQRVIKVKFDKELVEPSGFITSNPARIALDFTGTNVKMTQSSLTFNDSLLTQVNAAQGNGRTRVLLSLSKEAQYNTQVKGDEVWIYVSEAGASSSNVASSRQDAPAVAQTSSTDFGLDFKKGANRSGVISFRSTYENEPKIKTQSDRLIITLKNYPLSTQEQKNLDVTDFSTPVRTISVRRVGNDAQITIVNQGSWGYKITPRSGNRYTVSVTPEVNTVESAIKKAMAPVKPKKNFSGKHISLDFQDINVRTALQILAKESGMNIVASDNVQGQLTLALKDVPWDQALDLILEARDLVQDRNGNIINIMPRKDKQEIEENILKAQQIKEDIRPLISQTFQLKYKNVEELRDVLKLSDSSSSNRDSKSILTSRGSALIDPATNTLIVNDVATVLQKFQKLIDELDVASRQVMVETRIVEADDKLNRDLGMKFGYARAGRTGWGNSMDSARENRNVGVGQATGIQLGPNINLPSAATSTAIGLVRSIGSSALGLELQASETENRSKTIATPRVLTQDRKAAEIRSGTQIPYQTRDANGAYETDFKAAELSLVVTPRITPDNNIILDVQISKDDVDKSNTNADGEPAIRTRRVKTQAMVENGGTLVVGGIYQEKMSNVLSKVPVLGDLPVLGNLFKSNSREHSRNELLFFITPRIIEGQNSVMRY